MRNIRLFLAFCLIVACAPTRPDLHKQITTWCELFGEQCGTYACRWESAHSDIYGSVSTYHCDVSGVGKVHALACSNGTCTLAHGVMQ